MTTLKNLIRLALVARVLAVLILPCSADAPGESGRRGNLPASPKTTTPPVIPERIKDEPNNLGVGRGSLNPSFDVLLRGERNRFGRFDMRGNFLPSPHYGSLSRNSIPFNGPWYLEVANHVSHPTRMGEYRSGRIILGTLLPSGVFVPEIGSKVLDLFKDFDVNEPERIIYNLPKTRHAFWAEWRKAGRKAIPPASEPPAAGVPTGYKLLSFQEAYPNSPDKADPWFARVIGEVMELGYLSTEGEFIPDYSLPIFPYVADRKSIDRRVSEKHPLYYTLPKDGKKSEEVYEYRSGRLIQGTLQKSGNFVPELGSKILDFKEYNPNSPRRIYNLPGVLRPVKK